MIVPAEAEEIFGETAPKCFPLPVINAAKVARCLFGPAVKNRFIAVLVLTAVAAIVAMIEAEEVILVTPLKTINTKNSLTKLFPSWMQFYQL